MTSVIGTAITFTSASASENGRAIARINPIWEHSANAVIKNRDNVVCFLSRRLKISHTKEPIAPSKSVDIAHASEVNPVGS